MSQNTTGFNNIVGTTPDFSHYYLPPTIFKISHTYAVSYFSVYTYVLENADYLTLIVEDFRSEMATVDNTNFLHILTYLLTYLLHGAESFLRN